MEIYSEIEKKLIDHLLLNGWQHGDILTHQKISNQGRLVQVDLVLLYNLFPLAVIEVKSPRYQLESGESQVLFYAEMAGVPFAFLTNGESFIKFTSDGTSTHIKNLPFPEELWNEISSPLIGQDPLIFPPAKNKNLNTTPNFHQARAISSAIEKIKSSKKTAVILPAGMGASYIALQIAIKTVYSNYFDRALMVCGSTEIASQLLDFFNSFEGVPQPTPKNYPDRILDKSKIAIVQYPDRIFEQQADSFGNKHALIILIGVSDAKIIEKLLITSHDSKMLILANMVTPAIHANEFEIAYQYTVADAITEEDVRAPNGYKFVPLETIAEIFSGSSNGSKKDQPGVKNALVLNGRSLLDNGSINFLEANEMPIVQKYHHLKIRPNDILVSRVSSGRIRVGYVPSKLKGEFFISDSLAVIRVNQGISDSESIFEFLKSPNGQMNMSRYASTMGTAIRRISLASLLKMPVLIPEVYEAKSDQKPPIINLATQVKETIEKDILPVLVDLSKSESIDIEQSPSVEYVAEKLRSITSLLSPAKLEDKIVTDYPMPIAMSYRRFLDSKFNPYEQILRLRDVYEATSFFVYNIVLTDYLQRLNADVYNVQDSGARKAYGGFSMSKRIDFLEVIFDIARREKNAIRLFMPELTESGIVSKLKNMGEFRNQISHTAATTEVKQRKLISIYKPIVEDILQSLNFLTSYKLVRIPDIKFKNGKWIRKMEIYTGVVPQLDEFEIPSGNEQIKAESDHLILLDQEDQFLDLFPVCQLLASEETHDEMHLCFLKQRKAEQKKLVGESVQGSFEVTLNGYDIFEELQKKAK